MYRVLLPVDEHEDRARAQVDAVFALPTGDELFVDILHVHEGMSGPDAEWAAGGFSEEYAEAMDENVRSRSRLPRAVETAAERFESQPVEYAIREATGDPAEAILAAAAERDSDVIVVGVKKRSPVGKALFGSVAQKIILDGDRPVTVVPTR
ncbi:universal stress protein [Haloferacaceae archaeon DSL9]